MAEKEIFYEMLWDCAQCNTKGMLGSSHRHCPTCGAAQDPTRRYFPKPGEEVEAKNHKFVGADWSCSYCDSPNSAAAAHCTNCGAGKDGTKPVAIVVETTNAPMPLPAPAPTAPGSHWMRWVFGLLVLAVVVIGMMFFTTKETTATVSQRSWERNIQIERMVSVSDSAWCESLPTDAYSISRSKEVRSTRRVEDGQDCHDERQDKGDGTFVKNRICSPRYRSEPVYDYFCHFQINRWRTYRTVKATSQDSLLPMWPSVGRLNNNVGAMDSMTTLGAERQGSRHENYVLILTAKDKTWTCNVPESVWINHPEETTTPIKVRMTGGADCGSLK